MRLSMTWVITCCALAGCTVVNDPGRYQGGGQGDAGADGGAPRVEVRQFCAEYADVICTSFFGCCSTAMPLRNDPQFDDYFASCTMEAKRVCEDGADLFSPILEELVDDELTGYDPVLGAEVLAEGRALADACSPGFLAWGIERDGIARALRGTREGGADCTPGPLAGLRPDYAALLSCQVGDDGTYRACSQRGSVWNCVDRGSDGDPCVSYFDCVDDHYCTALVGGACTPRKEDGMPCNANGECLSLFCTGTATVAGTCEPPSTDDVYCPEG